MEEHRQARRRPALAVGVFDPCGADAGLFGLTVSIPRGDALIA